MWLRKRHPVTGPLQRATSGMACLVHAALLSAANGARVEGSGAGAAARQALPEGAADGSGSKRKWYEDQKKKRVDELKRLGLEPEQARAADPKPNPAQPHHLVGACRRGHVHMRAAGPRPPAWDRGDACQAQY